MAQENQIVPKYSFPYNETVINDYTQVTNDATTTTIADPIRFIFAFTSGKGIDNKWVRKNSATAFKKCFGNSNYKKYGQPIMMPLSILENNAGNTEIWCMRVMPENATSSHRVVSLYYHADTATEVPNPVDRKFRIKFIAKEDTTGAIKTKKDLEDFAAKLDGAANNKGQYVDGEGFIQAPGFLSARANGRGTYGDDYRVRLSQALYYENEYGIKMYNFEVISSSENLSTVSTYTGCVTTSDKYTTETLINDILDDTDDGVAPVDIRVSEEAMDQVYEAYVEFCKQQYTDLKAKLAEMKASADPVYTTEQLAVVEKLINKVIPENIVSEDTFDPIFGLGVYKNDGAPFLAFPAKLTDDIDTDAEGFVAANYTTDDIITFDSVECLKLVNGSDGYFTTPRTVDITTYVDGSPQISQRQWSYQEEVNDLLIKAYTGELDKRILTSKRIKANALFDANYDYTVKCALADLAVLRNDALCYLDTGIIENLSTSVQKSLIADYSVFTSYLISKNLHHYYIKEPNTQKRVAVTITYFLATMYANHILQNGAHIPFVKEAAQLSGHVKDSLSPSIENYETELKETLCVNRFNYFETIDDNVYQRATQNTSQMANSDLLEESNVTTLFNMKRIVEKDLSVRTYDFAEADQRNAFRNYEVAKFASWVGKDVLSFDIAFRMNEWEAERSILHAYIVVVFRGLQKQSILEIDINKRTYVADEEEA